LYAKPSQTQKANKQYKKMQTNKQTGPQDTANDRSFEKKVESSDQVLGQPNCIESISLSPEAIIWTETRGKQSS
jgi:hypothetical protein